MGRKKNQVYVRDGKATHLRKVHWDLGRKHRKVTGRRKKCLTENDGKSERRWDPDLGWGRTGSFS